MGLLMVFWRPGPNIWFGVRLPWTLADSYIWNKSWRLASRLLMVMGITVLISWRAFWISTAHLVGLSTLYTAILYRWKYGTWRFWKEAGWIDYRPVARCRRCGHFHKLDRTDRLDQTSCEACGAQLPDPNIGLRALWPPWAKNDQPLIK
jgi:SdpI/YfhL protein family